MSHPTLVLDNGDFQCLVHLQPTPSVGPEAYHLQFSSRWLGSKAPEALHTKLSITLGRQGLVELRQLIDAQLQG
jgi:hypothetical protein